MFGMKLLHYITVEVSFKAGFYIYIVSAFEHQSSTTTKKEKLYPQAEIVDHKLDSNRRIF